MELEYLQKDINSLSLIAACACNLKCEYCLISSTEHEKSNELQKKNIEAIQNGDYLKNVKKTLNTLNIGFNKIHQLSLWGQEPTLVFDYFTNQLDQWVETFPNVNFFSFSTNAMAPLDCVVRLIKRLDELINHEFQFSIQFSYDGIDSTNNFRKANNEKIVSNVKNFVLQMNEIKLKNVKIILYGHGVVPIPIMTKMNSMDVIEEYYKELDTVIASIEALNINKNITINPTISCNLESPYQASIDDGINFASFIKRSRQTEIISDIPRNISTCGDGLLYGFQRFFELLNQHGYTEIDDLCEKYWTNKNEFFYFMRDLSQSLYCGQNYCELKIMYDGTILPCQNCLHSLDYDNIAKEKNIQNEVLRSNLTHDGYFNVLKDSEKKIDKVFYMYKVMKETSYYYIFQQVVSLMQFMSLNNQIDESYKNNHKKIVQHAMYLAGLYCCSYNNQIMTGSVFHRHTGLIRLYCNGALDVIFDYGKKYLKDPESVKREF